MVVTSDRPHFALRCSAQDRFRRADTAGDDAELLGTIRNGDHTIACAAHHGEYGWEVQTFKDGEFNRSRRFETHAQALQWAELERDAWSKPE